MSKVVELKQKRAAVIEKQKSMVQARSESESKVFTDDQKTEWENLQRQVEDYDAQIKEEEQIEDFQRNQVANKAKAQNRKANGKEGGEDAEKERIYKRFSITKALRSNGRLEGAEKEVN